MGRPGAGGRAGRAARCRSAALPRREALGALAGAGALGGLGGAGGARAEAGPRGPAARRPGTLIDPGRAPVVCPAWLEGCWRVAPVLTSVEFPAGRNFVTSRVPGVTKASIVEAADIGRSIPSEPIEQLMRFVRRGPGRGDVQADRALNVGSSMDALLGKGTVRRVEYDPEKNARRLSVLFQTPRRGGGAPDQATDLRSAELFLNYGRGWEVGEDEFWAEQLWRQVSQAKRQGAVGDYDVVERFVRSPTGVELAYERYISAFLQPQDPRYFDVGDRAVAIYAFSGTLRPDPQCGGAGAAAPEYSPGEGEIFT